MASAIEDRIKAAEERLRKLKARNARAKARARAAQSRTARREDTRRKVLVGAIVLEKVDRDVIDRTTFNSWLEDSLAHPDDRALFHLPSPPS